MSLLVWFSTVKIKASCFFFREYTLEGVLIITPLKDVSLPGQPGYLSVPRRSQPLDTVNTVGFHPTFIYHRWIW
jgi:hypothetical protein